MTPDDQSDRYEVRSLVRGLRLLEALERVGEPMRLTDLAQELSIERATLFRYCSTLTRHGYMHLEPTTKMYSLGPRLRSLGFAAQGQWAWLDQVRAELPTVAERFSGAASFAILDEAEIIYIEREVADRALNFQIDRGDRLPAWTTSIGKVLLADLPDDQVVELMSEYAPDTDLTAFMAELTDIRNSGVAFNIGGTNRELNSVAVALRLRRKAKAVGGINLAGAASFLSLARLRAEVAPVLLAVSGQIADPSPGSD